jgi:uncharacterized membrane protein
MAPVDKSARLQYLDWMRGLAALIMLQGHSFHSFTKPELRNSGAYVLSQFVGGIAPAIFLFLTGVTLAFRMDKAEVRGVSAGGRLLAALRRARYLVILAFLFRIQLWLFGLPKTSWTDIFRVDVLNSMALAVAVLSIMAVFRTVERVRLCAILGVLIAAASPLVSQIHWSPLPAVIKNYLAPDYLFFSFFPWAAFLAFGLSVGSVIRLLKEDQMDRAMQWAALIGLALIAGGRYFADLPYSLYSKSDFWLDSPTLILIKLGILLLIVSFSFLWNRFAAAPSWSFVRQLGSTSLLVYWVHVEIVYGRWFGSWKENLDTTQAATFAFVLILAMLALSIAKTSGNRWSRMPAALRWYPFTPRRVSGD